MSPRGRLLLLAALLASLLTAGTVGYRLIEGWPWFDCLYHAVITVSTVGYMEVHPLTTAGRAFTIGLILASLAGVWIAMQALVGLVLELNLDEFFWRRRMSREIANVSGHVVVCGHGGMGSFVADEVRHAGLPVVVIERDPERVRAAVADGHLALEGDATSDDLLTKAGILRARTAVCALPTDGDNVFLTLSLRLLRPDLEIISRYDDKSSREKLLKAGANHAVSPKLMGGHRVAGLVLRPAATEFLDQVTRGRELELRVAEIAVQEQSALAGCALAQAHLRRDFDAMVVAMRQPDGTWIYTPAPHAEIAPGSTLVLIGRTEGVNRLLARESRA